MREQKQEVDRFQWHVKLKCVVEIIKTGHFPNTVIVKLPGGNETEIELNMLNRKR